MRFGGKNKPRSKTTRSDSRDGKVQSTEAELSSYGELNRDDRSDFQNSLGGKLSDASANLPAEYGFTHAAAAGDVNGDGAPDLYVGNICCGAPPGILINDGSGGFRGLSRLPARLPARLPDRSPLKPVLRVAPIQLS